MSKSLILALIFLTSTIVAQETSPDPAKIHFDKGLALTQEMAFEEALVEFEKSARLDPSQPATFVNMGSVLIELRRHDKAEDAFRKAISIEPQNGIIHSELCRSLSLQQKHAEAIAACDKGVELSPRSDRTELMRLVALQNAGRDPAQLQRMVDGAISRFRASEAILIFAIDYYFSTRDFRQALPLLETLVRDKPGVSKFHGVLAEVYLRIGRGEEAIGSARTALSLEPDNPYANYAMGHIFFELGLLDETIEAFEKVNSDDPRLDDSIYFQAIAESRRGRNDVALTLIRRLLEKDPQNLGFNYEYASKLSVLNRDAEAIRYYNRALAISPGNIDVISGLGMSQMMIGEFQQAISSFEELVRLRPDNENYKMFLAVARGRQTLVHRVPDLIKRFESDQQNAKLLADLISILVFSNRVTEADEYIQKLYAMDPSDDQVFVSLAISMSEAGKKDLAITAYERSLSKKENPAAFLGLASIYRERGQFEKASHAFAKVIELKPDTPNIMKGYADMLRENGKRREALDMYKRSLALLPLNAPALFEAGLLSLKLGDRNAAITYLDILSTVDRRMASNLRRIISMRLWGEN